MLVSGAAVPPMKVCVHRLGLLGVVNSVVPRSKPFVTPGECHTGGMGQALIQLLVEGSYQTLVERNG